jgi:hypothetical protein
MTDLTIDRTAQLTEAVHDAPTSGEPPRVAEACGVRLARLLALAAISPAQAVEVGAGLLALVELDPAGEQRDSDERGPASDRITVDVDGRVVIAPVAPAGASPRGGAALLGELAVAGRARIGPGNPVDARLVDELDRAVAELPVAGAAAARQRLEEACAVLDRELVRAELGALVRTLTKSTGTGSTATAGPGRAERAPPQAGPRRDGRTRIWAWLLSVTVLVAVVALEVVLLRDDITADVHLLLDAGRTGSAASTGPELDGLPVAPPAPPAAGAVAGVDLRPLAHCTPGAPCTVRVVLRLLPGADPRTASWSFRLTDRCTGTTDTASGGSVTVPAGVQQVTAVNTVLLPAYRAVAVEAVTELPAAAAAPPVLLGSCTADRPTG